MKRKESLQPPPKRNVTWSEYIQSPPGQHPVLGRTPKCKESSRAFKATVAMSEDFPLTVDMLLNVLEVGNTLEQRDYNGKHQQQQPRDT